MDEESVLALLQGPVTGALAEAGFGDLAQGVRSVSRLGRQAFQVETAEDIFILRFAGGADRLAVLEKETRIQRGLAGRVTARLPDTRMIYPLGGPLPFAVHRRLPGEALTSELLATLPAEALSRLTRDLVRFFVEMHTIPLDEAAAWMGIAPGPARAPEVLAAGYGKPLWFSLAEAEDWRAKLADDLSTAELDCLDRTAVQMAALPVDPGWLVFGHGDMHGFNMAITRDGQGVKFSGAFDLECAGILDLHEDFFRLSLVSEDLQERVLAEYSRETGRRTVRERAAVYYRAFLFYLMAEHEPGSSSRAHLRRMLAGHLSRA